jgi:hypothetical protein
MRHLLVALALAALATASHAGQARPDGTNCHLLSPPEAAGEVFNHGVTLRVYPRAVDIGSEYSGCQVTWMPVDGKWIVLWATEVKEGDPVRIWAPDAGLDVAACRYRKGSLVSGVAAQCAAPHTLLVKSVAHGCVEKIRAAVTAGGLGASEPTGCKHE